MGDPGADEGAEEQEPSKSDEDDSESSPSSEWIGEGGWHSYNRFCASLILSKYGGKVIFRRRSWLALRKWRNKMMMWLLLTMLMSGGIAATEEGLKVKSTVLTLREGSMELTNRR
ncbi:hypothetical protein DFQ26_003085 [Actinomortierella ambigua]|nr:hypothetical protein DFQ26_003085 [Actinomortierella ambigua]